MLILRLDKREFKVKFIKKLKEVYWILIKLRVNERYKSYEILLIL